VKVVDELAEPERQQREAGRQEEAKRVVREHHADDLYAVAARVVDRVKLRSTGPLAVFDRDVLHRIPTGEKGHRHGGDAGEAGRKMAKILTGDVGSKRAETGVEVGNLG